MKVIDKAKAKKVLNRSVGGWDMGWCWDIINTSIDQMAEYGDTVEDLEYIQWQLSKCVNAMKRNKDEITVESKE